MPKWDGIEKEKIEIETPTVQDVHPRCPHKMGVQDVRTRWVSKMDPSKHKMGVQDGSKMDGRKMNIKNGTR